MSKLENIMIHDILKINYNLYDPRAWGASFSQGLFIFPPCFQLFGAIIFLATLLAKDLRMRYVIHHYHHYQMLSS